MPQSKADEDDENPNLVIYGALFANLGIAVAKFVAAGITGSASMLSEGIHSAVDSTNQVLLLYGKHRSKKPADRKHPFGYGRELYFWSFVVAILIFAIGAGLSGYEGYVHILDPEKLTDPTINYIVLGVAVLFEGASWTIAVRDLGRTKGERGWWEAVRKSKDPTTLVVVFEDSAALIGLVIAALGVFISHKLGDPRIDGVASVLIGLVLAVVAMLLAREAKGLLIGEPADQALVDKVEELLASEDGVTTVNHVLTVHLSPNEIFVAVSTDFDDALTMGEGETLIEHIEERLQDAVPELTAIYIRPEKAGDQKRPADKL